MKQFFKTNLVLVAGVALPLALMLLFYIAGAVTRASVADPQYDMVFAVDYTLYPPWQIGLEENVLTIRYAPASNSSARDRPPWPQLYLFDHKTMTVEPLSINYNHIVNGIVQDPVIEELNTHILSAEQTSPDGYQLAHDYYYGGGLFSELFDFGNDRNTGILRKQYRTIPLAGARPDMTRAQFIAWVGGKKQ
ncbi:MAG: hypothetical protein WA005_18990 [Candidatus Binataceae bacterium]